VALRPLRRARLHHAPSPGWRTSDGRHPAIGDGLRELLATETTSRDAERAFELAMLPIYVFREGSVLFVRSYNTDYEFELP
jgi:hypothetical protein